MTDAIQEVWQRIEAAWQTSAPPDSPPLTSGATQAEMQHVEARLGIALPQDVRTSYRLHNGRYTVQLVSAMEILPLDEMAARWGMLRDLLEDEGWARQQPYYFSEEVMNSGGWTVGPVQPVWYH